LIFADIFGIRKLGSLWAIVWRCLCDSTFNRFSRTPTRDRQTDRQTHDDSIYRANTASCSKKFIKCRPSGFRTSPLTSQGETLRGSAPSRQIIDIDLVVPEGQKNENLTEL